MNQIMVSHENEEAGTIYLIPDDTLILDVNSSNLISGFVFSFEQRMLMILTHDPCCLEPTDMHDNTWFLRLIE